MGVFKPMLMLWELCHTCRCVFGSRCALLQDGNSSHLVPLGYTAEQPVFSHFVVAKMAEGPFIHSNHFWLEERIARSNKMELPKVKAEIS